MKPHRGVLILVFGILGLVLSCPIFAVMAWMMGNTDMAEIQAGRMDPEGKPLTNVGRILGMVGCALFLVGIVLFCLLAGLPLLFGGAAAVRN